jgi:retron-type reverse transcriptase
VRVPHQHDESPCRSYGFRQGLGCKDALREVDRLLREGYTFVVDADLRSYFDTIPHARLLERVEEHVSDGRVLELIEGYLHQDIIKDMEKWRPTGGTPQGAVISPLLANIYLHGLDGQMVQKGYRMVRYADDSAPRRRGKEAETVAWKRSCCASDEGKAPRNRFAGADSKSPPAAGFSLQRIAPPSRQIAIVC